MVGGVRVGEGSNLISNNPPEHLLLVRTQGTFTSSWEYSVREGV